MKARSSAKRLKRKRTNAAASKRLAEGLYSAIAGRSQRRGAVGELGELDSGAVSQKGLITLSDFNSKNAAGRRVVKVPEELQSNVLLVIAQLGKIATALEKEHGGPIQIALVSGWRSPEHNARVGGAKESQHLIGRAVDFRAYVQQTEETGEITNRLIPHAETASTILELMRAGEITKGGYKAYNSFTHYDIRGYIQHW